MFNLISFCFLLLFYIKLYFLLFSLNRIEYVSEYSGFIVDTILSDVIIVGPEEVCMGSDSIEYSIIGIKGVRYEWGYSGMGMVILYGQGSNKIIVRFTEGATNGVLSVIVKGICENIGPITKNIHIKSTPDEAGEIFGLTSICAHQIAEYHIDPVEGATSYNWEVPDGSIILSGQGTTSIQVQFGTNSGFIRVFPLNECGTSGPSSKHIIVNNIPISPSGIIGDTSICFGSTQIYSINPISGATNYIWSVPNDWTIINGQGTTSINVYVGSSSGNVSVYASNDCGNSDPALLPVNVIAFPFAPIANTATNITQTSFTANWYPATNATKYYLDVNTDSLFTGTWILNNHNVGNVLSYNVTGLNCGAKYYYRVRAGNNCGTSGNSNVISVTTAACVPSCGTQIWMIANMNVGIMINDPAEQDNDSQVEKYCYNNNSANCATYGGLYQWAEALQGPYIWNGTNQYPDPIWMTCDPCSSSGRQGICPSGYHVPTDLEWSRYEWCVETQIVPTGSTPLSNFQNNTGWRGTNDPNIGPGAKLKASSSNSPSWNGTNASGFTALSAGYRFYGGGYNYLGSLASFWSATESSTTSAWYRSQSTGGWQSYRLNPTKTYGFSLRCLQN